MFRNLSIAALLPFETLLISGWNIGELPQVTEREACRYLKCLRGFTNIYHTGVHLCHCGHVYDIAVAPSGSRMHVRANCRPTMRKHPPFYKFFVSISPDETNDLLEEETSHTIEGGNCSCAAGKTQSCVNVTALLFTLAEVSPAACTSLPCAWSRPSTIGGKSTQSTDLYFNKASSEGYLPCSGPPLDVHDLLKAFEKEGILTAGMCFQQEEERYRT